MGNCFYKEKCMICSYSMRNNEELVTMTACCGVVFHKSCYEHHKKRRNMCPNCRYVTIIAPKHIETAYL